MGTKTREVWEGGYVRTEKDGSRVFVIERQVAGERFHVSTRAHSYSAAMKQLERFEADPLNYSPVGAENAAPLRLTAKLQLEYYDWQIEQGITRRWAKETGKRLTDWIEDLRGVDLRRATLRDHIKPALEGKKGKQHRIIALKAFYAWLRKEKHLLTSGQDPTLDLPVPQGRPEKWVRRKAVEVERVRAAAEHLEESYLDVLVLLMATGWHVTELERFVRSEEAQVVRQPEGGKVLAVLNVLHKNRDTTRTPITDAEALDAAERLRARRTVPRYLNATLKAACQKAEVKPFTFGVMRHSVATWAIEAGALPATVASFLNHKNERTTLRFYADVNVPTATVELPPLRLVKG